jgi:hypothetical protein
MKTQIVFKDQQGEIVQTVRGDGLEQWLETAKQSSTWRSDLSYEFEEYDDRNEIEDAEILQQNQEVI